MVDSITSYRGGQYPSLLANFAVNNKEPAYSNNEYGGHWPSIYLIEGLGQCCNLVIIISALENGLMKAGLRFESMDNVLKGLINDEPDEIIRTLKGILNQRLMATYANVGFLGSADMKITGHARHGQIISYEVRQNQVFGSLFHSTVRAYTDNNLIAYGTLVSAGR